MFCDLQSPAYRHNNGWHEESEGFSLVRHVVIIITIKNVKLVVTGKFKMSYF